MLAVLKCRYEEEILSFVEGLSLAMLSVQMLCMPSHDNGNA